MTENLSKFQQENILVLLCYSEKNLPILVNSIESNLFETSIYREIADKAISFYIRFKKPIKEHLADEFELKINPEKDSQQNLDKAELYKNIIGNIHESSVGINEDYVMTKLEKFVHTQTLKAGVMEAHALLMKDDNEGAEIALEKAKKAQMKVFDYGVRLSDTKKVLDCFNTEEEFFNTGIKQFDDIGAAPFRKGLYLLIGLPGFGKSWCLNQIGKTNLIVERKKVLHITLEMSWRRQMARYVQSFFSFSKRYEKLVSPTFKKDKYGRFTGVDFTDIDPKLSIEDKKFFSKLGRKMKTLKNPQLVVKDFPSGQLTIKGLKIYLDLLGEYSNFIPDIIILDYANIMHVGGQGKDRRIALGENLVNLRGLAHEYNVGLATVAQLNREGKKAEGKWLDEAHLQEDFSSINTADVMISYNRTEAEKLKNLARLLLVKNRDDISGRRVLISQAYAIGQFMIKSVLMPNTIDGTKNYWCNFEEVEK